MNVACQESSIRAAADAQPYCLASFRQGLRLYVALSTKDLALSSQPCFSLLSPVIALFRSAQDGSVERKWTAACYSPVLSGLSGRIRVQATNALSALTGVAGRSSKSSNRRPSSPSSQPPTHDVWSHQPTRHLPPTIPFAPPNGIMSGIIGEVQRATGMDQVSLGKLISVAMGYQIPA